MWCDFVGCQLLRGSNCPNVYSRVERGGKPRGSSCPSYPFLCTVPAKVSTAAHRSQRGRYLPKPRFETYPRCFSWGISSKEVVGWSRLSLVFRPKDTPDHSSRKDPSPLRLPQRVLSREARAPSRSPLQPTGLPEHAARFPQELALPSCEKKIDL